jgi:hypothetical protein
VDRVQEPEVERVLDKSPIRLASSACLMIEASYTNLTSELTVSAAPCTMRGAAGRVNPMPSRRGGTSDGTATDPPGTHSGPGRGTSPGSGCWPRFPAPCAAGCGRGVSSPPQQQAEVMRHHPGVPVLSVCSALAVSSSSSRAYTVPPQARRRFVWIAEHRVRCRPYCRFPGVVHVVTSPCVRAIRALPTRRVCRRGSVRCPIRQARSALR